MNIKGVSETRLGYVIEYKIGLLKIADFNAKNKTL